MNKNTSGTQPSASSKSNSKPKTNLRGSYGKLTLDVAKFDFKSIAPSTTAASVNPYSPMSVPLEKVNLASYKTKSPRTNQNTLGISIENFDPKETYTIDKKIHPQTTKAVRNSYLASNSEKPKKISNSNEKVPPNKSKEGKAPVSNYETLIGKKTSNTKEGGKREPSLNRRDSKPKIMEEPPKKYSMPTNLTLSLNTMYATGSNSYRAPLNSTPSEQANVNNRAFAYAPLNRRNSQKSDVEEQNRDQGEEQVVAGTGTGTHKHSQQGPLHNNFLGDLPAKTQEHMKRTVKMSSSNAENTNSTNTRLVQSVDKVYSPKEGGNYGDILRLVGDKNKEIHTLIQDKAKLKSTLDMLNDEVNNYKRMKLLLKEKEKMIENLQKSLNEAAKESEGLKKGCKDLMNSQDENSNLEYDENKRTKVSPSDSEMDGRKIVVGTGQQQQPKTLTDSDELYDSLEQKNNLLEVITKKNQYAKPKKGEGSYALFGLENKPEKPSQFSEQTNNTMDLYARNFSGTFEDTFTKKMNESPYYDALKNGSKRTEKPAVAAAGKKGTAGSKKLSPDPKGSKTASITNVGGKDKDSLLGTPRKTEQAGEKGKKQSKMQASNTGGMDIDILKRKFSHEPRSTSEAVAELFGKKQSGVEAGSTLACTAEKEPVGEGVDMSKALGELKDRIAKLLNKHKDDHRKLRVTYEIYAQKLEKLAKE